MHSQLQPLYAPTLTFLCLVLFIVAAYLLGKDKKDSKEHREKEEKLRLEIEETRKRTIGKREAFCKH